ncbi:hypothetical protein M3Y94_00943600 [Aphelenchoides besseyi]|nr:hypothetical protein M3Y94_00943600 [Aphelenchoides besseyi]KAI6224876.1 hypothetical protein M3Y95_00799000 [Aphelenchoides besseyi]
MPDDLPRIPKKRGPRNKPRDVAWIQQELSAYRPLYTFRCAIPLVSILSFCCLAISIAFYKSSLKGFELEVDYTDCEKQICDYELKLPEIQGQVLFFYGMRGFHQNMRKYQQSRNDRQLARHLRETDECYPFQCLDTEGKPSTCKGDQKVPIVPCGAVANSIFNDTFKLFYHNGPPELPIREVPLTTAGLLHPSFRSQKYRNPKKCTDENSFCGSNCTAKCPGFESTAKPPWWPKPIAEIGDVDTGWALENFDFIQWMETSALPNFRKIWRRLNQQSGSPFASGLPASNYTLRIVYNYPVRGYSARKLFVIQSDGPLGPKAEFQIFAFFCVGFFLLVFSAFMVIIEFAPGITQRLRRCLSYFQSPEISGL